MTSAPNAARLLTARERKLHIERALRLEYWPGDLVDSLSQLRRDHPEEFRAEPRFAVEWKAICKKRRQLRALDNDSLIRREQELEQAKEHFKGQMEQVTQEAERERLHREQSERAKRHRDSALMLEVKKILRSHSGFTWRDVHNELRAANPGNVILSVTAEGIEWYATSRRAKLNAVNSGKTKFTPTTALKDLVSRAKKQLRENSQ